MTREEAIRIIKEELCYIRCENDCNMDECKANCENKEVVEVLEQEPCEDAISRQAVLDLTGKSDWFESSDDYNDFVIAVCELPSVNPQESKMEEFAKWVATEIFDDDWEYNKETFAELACRKLAKLGIVIRMGDEWELIEPQESEVTDADSN